MLRGAGSDPVGSLGRPSRVHRAEPSLSPGVRSRDELVESSRDLDVALLRGVLVTQSSGARSVTHPVHQLRCRGAGRRRDRVRGVSEIVKVEVRREVGDRGPGLVPVAIDGTLSQYLGAFPGEELAVRAGRREVGEVALEFGDEERGERDGPNACFGLGGAHDERSAVEFDLLLLHANGSVEEIDVAAFEAQELASTEAEKAGEQDQASVSRRCGVGECPDLFDGCHRPLGGSLGSCSFDDAGVADDQLVDDGGLEDCA